MATFYAEIHYVKEINTVVVAFRGTDAGGFGAILDWVTNLNFEPTNCTLAPPCGKAHSGFHQEMMAVASTIYQTYLNILSTSSNPRDLRIGLTGHSLGGALAQLFGMYVCGRDTRQCNAISWINVFGAPKFCKDLDCASRYQDLLGSRTKRFINGCKATEWYPGFDPVAMSPGWYAGEPAIVLPHPDTEASGDNVMCHQMGVYLDALRHTATKTRCDVIPRDPPSTVTFGSTITSDLEIRDPRPSDPAFDFEGCYVDSVPGPLAPMKQKLNVVLGYAQNIKSHIDLRISVAMQIDNILPMLQGLGTFGSFFEETLAAAGLGVELSAKMMLRLAVPGPKIDFGLEFQAGVLISPPCGVLEELVSAINALVTFVEGLPDKLRQFGEILERWDPPPVNVNGVPVAVYWQMAIDLIQEAESNIPDLAAIRNSELMGLLNFVSEVCSTVDLSIGFSLAFLDGNVDPANTWVGVVGQHLGRRSGGIHLSLDMLPSCVHNKGTVGIDGACLANGDCESGNCNLFSFIGNGPPTSLCFGTCAPKLGEWEAVCFEDQQCGEGLTCCGGLCIKEVSDGELCLLDCACQSGACTLSLYDSLKPTCGKLPHSRTCTPGFDHHCQSDHCCHGFCGGAPDGTICLFDECCAAGNCRFGRCGGKCTYPNHNECGDDGWCDVTGTCISKFDEGHVCLTGVECASGVCSWFTCKELRCDPARDGHEATAECCRPGQECDYMEGDCDEDNDCKGDLICKQNTNGDNGCPAGTHPETDCCGPRCDPSRESSANCCTNSKPCEFMEGDCDSDAQCQGDLECGINNCGNGFTDQWDCCAKKKGSLCSADVHCASGKCTAFFCE